MLEWYGRNRKDGRPEKALIDAQEQLAAAQTRIAELEAQLSSRADCDGKGLPAVVCSMRRQQQTDEEIAAHFYDNNTWCSQSQVGALLHPDTARVLGNSMRQRARRLLGLA